MVSYTTLACLVRYIVDCVCVGLEHMHTQNYLSKLLVYEIIILTDNSNIRIEIIHIISASTILGTAQNS